MTATLETPPVTQAQSRAPVPALAAPSAPGPFKPSPPTRKPDAKPAPVNQAAVAAASQTNDPAAGVREYDATDPVLLAVRDRVAYSQDRRDYWRRTDSGIYVPATEVDLKRHLRREGLDIGTPLGLQFTRFDNAVCYVQDHAAVKCAFDLAGHRAGVFVADGAGQVVEAMRAALASRKQTAAR